MLIRIDEIKIPERVRKDFGDLKNLAESIRRYGLINPITVMASDDGYILIAGFRRLNAMKFLGNDTIPATVLSVKDAE